MFPLRNSLILRITLPIIILVLTLWGLLYFFVLTPVSEFAKSSIDDNLASFSRRIDNICNINFDHLLLSGLANSNEALIVEQALTLGQIEDFFHQESLKGLVYNLQDKKLLFQLGLPEAASDLINRESEKKELNMMKVQNDKFYLYFSYFESWDWKIIIVKNVKDYSSVIIKTQKVYLYAIGSVLIIALLLIFFIYQSINIPVNTIIKTINKKQIPKYKGINVFQFLSDTIANMMDSIRQGSEKYKILLENSNHIVWEIDRYSRFTYISPTVTSILGYIPDEIIGNTPFDFIPSDEAEFLRVAYNKIVAKRGNLEGFIHNYIHKDGSYIVLETNGIPMFDNNGKFSGYRGINKDITQRVNAEKEKTNAQKEAADQAKHALLGRVAGKMAHDFNNILGIIMGNTELALLDCDDEEILKTLNLTLEQTLRGKHLTKNLVVFAKDHDIMQEFFNLNEKINLVIDLLKKDLDGINVTFEEEPNLYELFADPGMIENSLVNLIQNSIHAISKTKDPIIKIKTYCNEKNIYFKIEDNGCGIPEQYIDKIYEPSFTLKGKKDVTNSYRNGIEGTGYGMINAKKYIEQHNGSISVKSKSNIGTTLTIGLPVVNKWLTNIEKKEISKTNIKANKSILLVEDEISISDVLSRILTQKPCNHRVDIANSGHIAMNFFTKNHYDLISLDYILLGLETGLDFYKKVRKINKIIPILFVSGNIEFIESLENLQQEDNYIGHISKP
ncbi:MAG: PAS domain S-box protein, partial [Desulfobacteraceae bacterium]|nr:PAS domain S-box protein [Desulfobacteraceae bacterium]